jgi:hypothetical protein
MIPDGRVSRVRFGPWPFLREPSRCRRGLSADSHAPRPASVCSRTRPRFEGRHAPGSASGCHPGTAKCPEPLCPGPALPARGRCHAPPRRALPLLHRSYGLIRQTLTLPPPSALASFGGSWQVWTPTPAVPMVPALVSSHGASAFPALEPGRHLASLRTATSVRRGFRGCSHSLMFRPPSLLATQVAPTAGPCRIQGGRGFYVRAEHGALPPRASDMLAVRTEQLTAWGLSPHKIRSLVGYSSNATRHLRRASGSVSST